MIKRAVAVATVVLGTMSAAFGHQTTGPDPSTAGVRCGSAAHLQKVESPDGSQTLYLDVRDIGTPETGAVTGHKGGSLYNVWVYLESNGHPGVQTKAGTYNSALGENGGDTGSTETCTTSRHRGMKPDTLLF